MDVGPVHFLFLSWFCFFKPPCYFYLFICVFCVSVGICRRLLLSVLWQRLLLYTAGIPFRLMHELQCGCVSRCVTLYVLCFCRGRTELLFLLQVRWQQLWTHNNTIQYKYTTNWSPVWPEVDEPATWKYFMKTRTWTNVYNLKCLPYYSTVFCLGLCQ